MNKITELTRRDIRRIIKAGLPSNDPFDSTPTTINYWGLLSEEPKFFARLYDLKSLPSADPRYPNALDDITVHYHSDDYNYDETWFFDDERFQLRDGDGDEPLLKFLCEMLHPAVRDEQSAWALYRDEFNRLLKEDGYELVSVEKMSGRDVYGWREYAKTEEVNFPGSLFSMRYASFIDLTVEPPVDTITPSLDLNAKTALSVILRGFQRDTVYQPNENDSWTVNTDTLSLAIVRLNKYRGFSVVETENYRAVLISNTFQSLFAPFLFDICELLYDELEDSRKVSLSMQMNNLFVTFSLPFEMSNGGLICSKMTPKDKKEVKTDTKEGVEKDEGRYKDLYFKLLERQKAQENQTAPEVESQEGNNETNEIRAHTKNEKNVLRGRRNKEKGDEGKFREEFPTLPYVSYTKEGKKVAYNITPQKYLALPLLKRYGDINRVLAIIHEIIWLEERNRPRIGNEKCRECAWNEWGFCHRLRKGYDECGGPFKDFEWERERIMMDAAPYEFFERTVQAEENNAEPPGIEEFVSDGKDYWDDAKWKDPSKKVGWTPNQMLNEDLNAGFPMQNT